MPEAKVVIADWLRGPQHQALALDAGDAHPDHVHCRSGPPRRSCQHDRPGPASAPGPFQHRFRG